VPAQAETKDATMNDSSTSAPSDPHTQNQERKRREII
jgi:hypothetical protein